MNLFPDLHRTVAREILASIRARFALALLASLVVPLARAPSRRSEPLRSFRRDFALPLSGQSESIRKEVHARSAGAPKAAVLTHGRRVGDVLQADWELPDER